MHLLGYSIFMGGLLYIGGLKHGYWNQIMRHRITHKLSKKYKNKIIEYKCKIDSDYDKLPHQKPNKIWICWFQGMDAAPQLVKACYLSICKHLGAKYEITVIDENNIYKYVQFPEFIIEKYKKGYISKTMFSDIVRLELLSQYGGIWIDATVFCSGEDIPSYMLNDDLFLFQIVEPDLLTQATRIDSWYISSCQNNKLILLTKYLLFDYWQHYNILVDYFLMFDFFEMAISVYNSEWRQVIPFSRCASCLLQPRLFDQYDDSLWCGITKQTPFHKLTYKFEETYHCDESKLLNRPNTIYKEIINKYEL